MGRSAMCGRRSRRLCGTSLQFRSNVLTCGVVASDLALQVAEFSDREALFGGSRFDRQAAVALHVLIYGNVFLDLIGWNFGIGAFVAVLDEPGCAVGIGAG